MNRGYVRLWRRSEDSAVWQDDCLWRLWCYLLMRARYTDGWVGVDRVAAPVMVRRGQLIVGRFSLHKALFPKKKKSTPAPITTWRRLQTLQNLGNVIIQTTTRYSLVTICNYDAYNTSSDCLQGGNDQQVISKRSADDQQVITKKKDKERKEESAPGEGFQGPLLPAFDTPVVRERLGAWFPYVAAHPDYPKRLPDVDLAAVSLCQQCGTPAVLTKAISQAIGAGWASIRPNAVNDNGKPVKPETKTRMFE